MLDAGYLMLDAGNEGISVGLSLANRREARKLGLLPLGKSSEAERERVQPQERNERVCVESPTPMPILLENPGLMCTGSQPHT